MMSDIQNINYGFLIICQPPQWETGCIVLASAAGNGPCDVATYGMHTSKAQPRDN